MKIFDREKFTNDIKTEMFNRMQKEKRIIRSTEFANQIGISKATFSRLQNGKTPDVETFLRVCKWLNVSPMMFELCPRIQE